MHLLHQVDGLVVVRDYELTIWAGRDTFKGNVHLISQRAIPRKELLTTLCEDVHHGLANEPLEIRL